jgi:CubicO group peptidase (beta-lactamase class C family)
VNAIVSLQEKPEIGRAMTVSYFENDFQRQADFAEMFSGFSSTGLKDAIIIQHNSILSDWHNEGTDRVNYIFSCTKSFLSALVGIAIDQQRIPSIDQPIAEYFPELPQLNPDTRFQQITIRHLLSMISGIAWPPMIRAKSMYNQMVRRENWVEFVLRRPMACEPGTQFNYCDGSSLLLSTILIKVNHMNSLSYAQRYLFSHLNITLAKWKENHGVNLGGTGLHLRTNDMTMLGYL